MRLTDLLGGAVCVAALATQLHAQQPLVDEQARRIDALQRRVDQLELLLREAMRRDAEKLRTPMGPAVGASKATPPETVKPVVKREPAAIVKTPTAPAPPAVAAPTSVAQATAIPGLLPPEPMGSQFEDALRSDLPGIAIRIPGSKTDVRLYGFAKLSAYNDFNARNQTDAPPPQTIPLMNSPAFLQGGDFGMSARFSRIGVDTRTLTDWGTFETRVEGDFGGGTLTSSNALFRLRLAWGELGTEAFRILIGQANSLWNEGLFETVNDATNLNQSFVRQPQIRATATLAKGLTGQVSLEFPSTQFTSGAGIFTPDSSFNGGLSPAFDSLPDLLGRMTYRSNGLELDMRGLLRELSMRTEGTAVAPPAVTELAVGWGVAGHARIPMRWVCEELGPDQLIFMGYYGQGIGRYFPGNTAGQDALSNILLPGTILDVNLDALPTYGATAAYRRFWRTQLRSNFAYSYAHQDFPSYALEFFPGSPSAIFLNRDMQQVIANLIWSPFATLHNGEVQNGWLDVGLEYMYTQRDVFGGDSATAPAGAGIGIANRIVGAVTMRF